MSGITEDERAFAQWAGGIKVAIADDGARLYEAEARQRGTDGILFEYHCFRCHHRHFIWSEVGRRHEQYGDARTVHAAKKESLRSQQVPA